MTGFTVPLLSDAPSAAEFAAMNEMQDLNWLGLVGTAETENRNAVAAFATAASNATLQPSPSPGIYALSWSSISFSTYFQLYGQLVPALNQFNPLINIESAIRDSIVYLPLTASLSLDSNFNLVVAFASPAPAPSTGSPVGSPIAGYPGMFYATKPWAGSYPALYPDGVGNEYAFEDSITFGPCYQQIVFAAATQPATAPPSTNGAVVTPLNPQL